MVLVRAQVMCHSQLIGGRVYVPVQEADQASLNADAGRNQILELEFRKLASDLLVMWLYRRWFTSSSRDILNQFQPVEVRTRVQGFALYVHQRGRQGLNDPDFATLDEIRDLYRGACENISQCLAFLPQFANRAEEYRSRRALAREGVERRFQLSPQVDSVDNMY